MIRAAELSDIPRLLEMGGKFAVTAMLEESVGYDAPDMADTFAYLIGDDNSCVLVGETGAIGGQRAPHPFNYSHWIAQELFWWSEGRDGLKLLSAFEDWAAEKCQSVRMIALDAVCPEATGRLYERRGYAPLEHGYIKRL